MKHAIKILRETELDKAESEKVICAAVPHAISGNPASRQ